MELRKNQILDIDSTKYLQFKFYKAAKKRIMKILL